MKFRTGLLTRVSVSRLDIHKALTSNIGELSDWMLNHNIEFWMRTTSNEYCYDMDPDAAGRFAAYLKSKGWEEGS